MNAPAESESVLPRAARRLNPEAQIQSLVRVGRRAIAHADWIEQLVATQSYGHTTPLEIAAARRDIEASRRKGELALNEILEIKASIAATAAAPKLTVVRDTTDNQFGRIPASTERGQAAKAQRQLKALRQWEANGSKGKRPETSTFDALRASHKGEQSTEQSSTPEAPAAGNQPTQEVTNMSTIEIPTEKGRKITRAIAADSGKPIGWHLFGADGFHVDSYNAKANAVAAVEALGDKVVVPPTTTEAKISRTDALKAEAAMIKAWEEAGTPDGRPATPVTDAKEAEMAAKAPKSAKAPAAKADEVTPLPKAPRAPRGKKATEAKS